MMHLKYGNGAGGKNISKSVKQENHAQITLFL